MKKSREIRPRAKVRSVRGPTNPDEVYAHQCEIARKAVKRVLDLRLTAGDDLPATISGALAAITDFMFVNMPEPVSVRSILGMSTAVVNNRATQLVERHEARLARQGAEEAHEGQKAH
jgi:hypothetical protein